MNERAGKRMETIAVHGGERRPGPEGSLVYPIYQGTVFGVAPGTSYHDIRYIRLSTTPSQQYLHDKLAALEGAEAAIATASGMAAFTTTLVALVERGKHIVAGDCLYGGSHDFLTHDAAGHGWSVSYVDATRPETWEAALRPETAAFVLETITNPLMRVARLREAAALTRSRGIHLVVDNTFATPLGCRPLELGADVVWHSATKYLNGHSDLVAGCIMGSHEILTKVRRVMSHYGASLDPHAGYLLARGIKTLALRVAAQSANAAALARALAESSKVAAVNHASLPSHPDHAYAREALATLGGMLSFRLRGGVEAADALLGALTIPTVAPSLGGVETLATRPSLTSHAGMSREERERMGVTDDLVRISSGIEATEDLVADFRQALDRV